MTREERRRAIADILRRCRVYTQDDLVLALRERGCSVTQATVSRDIREMGLVKVPDPPSGYRYALPEDGRSLSRDERIIREFITRLDGSGNLVVVRTLPGAAQGVGAAIDKIGWPEVMGTIAGDDTIFIALHSERDLELLLRRLKSFMEEI